MENRSSGRDGTNMNGEINSVRRFGHNLSYIYRGIKADIWDGGHRHSSCDTTTRDDPG